MDSTIILASGSPRRRQLLSEAGLRFECIPFDGDENLTIEDPKELVLALSKMKALSVLDGVRVNDQSLEDTVVIGADTVVSIDDKIIGKPSDEEDAFMIIKSLQGRTHQVYTGVTLCQYNKSDVISDSFVATTDVEFTPISNEEIKEYISSCDDWRDKAGAYGIQDAFGLKYVAGIKGDYYNVMGLPVSMLLHRLKEFLQ